MRDHDALRGAERAGGADQLGVNAPDAGQRTDEHGEDRGIEDQEDRHRAAHAEQQDGEWNPGDRPDRAQELGKGVDQRFHPTRAGSEQGQQQADQNAQAITDPEMEQARRDIFGQLGVEHADEGRPYRRGHRHQVAVVDTLPDPLP